MLMVGEEMEPWTGIELYNWRDIASQLLAAVSEALVVQRASLTRRG
jgi:hypothetical protein